jgi:hypothetical protein
MRRAMPVSSGIPFPDGKNFMCECVLKVKKYIPYIRGKWSLIICEK